MSQGLRVQKLAASAVSPLRSKFKFRNDLLLSGATWLQDVNYMRDIYDEIAVLWEQFTTPESDPELFKNTEPKLRDLVLGMVEVSQHLPRLRYVRQMSTNARHDFEIAHMYGKTGDFHVGLVYQSYALHKIHSLLESLSHHTTKTHPRKESKLAYGYDVSGEVTEGIGSNADQTALNDTAQPQDHHDTPVNPANTMMDTEAIAEFPELLQKKTKPNIFPVRTV